MLFTVVIALSASAPPPVDVVVVTAEPFIKAGTFNGSRCVTVSPQGKYYAISTDVAGKTVFQIRDLKTGKILNEPATGLGEFTPDETKFVGLVGDDEVAVCDAATGKRLLLFTRKEKLTEKVSVFSHSRIRLTNDRIIVRGRESPFSVYDLKTGKLVGEIAKDHRAIRICVSRGGRWIATMDRSSGFAYLYDAKTAEHVRTIDTRIFGKLIGLALSPDGKYLAASFGLRGVAVYDCASGEVKRRFSDKKVWPDAEMEFTDDGDRIIMTGTPLLPIPDGHIDIYIGWWDWKASDRFTRVLMKGQDGQKGWKFFKEGTFHPESMTGDGKTMLSHTVHRGDMLRLDLSKAKPLPAAKKE